MTPAARYAAAIDILDKVLRGEAAEKALTHWARANRFAGSGDRHALRDIVFDVLRCKRSYGVRGGAKTGRGLVLGALRAAGIAPDDVFTGQGYGPAALTDADGPGAQPEGLDALDCPDWLAPALLASLGDNFPAVMQTLQSRAPVFLRVNLRKGDMARAVAALALDGIETQPNPLSPTALEVLNNPRKVQTSNAYLDGLVELQDAASQAIVDELSLRSGQRVLDFCAGGGGKSLAMAAQTSAQFFAHDIAPARMKDLPARAKRAGVQVTVLASAALAKAEPFDLVLADAPCSGSGSWRRAPEAKWALSQARLTELCALQAQIMDNAAALVAKGGTLAYATCALLKMENQDQITAFLGRHSGWTLKKARVLTPLEGGDGFFIACLKRKI
ncbi:16S rRNA (cytosine967-C5)-methyltransferase [Pseudorhodobacter antarcticus]|uniref:16S rRNA (Cytosine967-C5)-methyltransferase n=1 Tax=Pseudorhodobacter antarcticus TaxID=1077947 RepID=A0A1H8BIU1_9RHOB|nr:RsmB/NOP family class I SAM-dependent RNA methyltransferase [Pseudorhodobacter antarcticus]SEM82775.1 16S rRNA (cytosine967-C5)-methyltransferase [Pseudorhodobacter antarcticus]